MKSYIYIFIFAFTLHSVPFAAAQPPTDNALEKASAAFYAAWTGGYIRLTCDTFSGGSISAQFYNNFNEQTLVIQALQDGPAAREWSVYSPIMGHDTGIFNSKGQGYQPWKRFIKNLCADCMTDPTTCLSNQP